MEDLPSPVSIASSTATAPSSASKVTYTTAGTPYNPSTSQPLQPPARRGRSLKWPASLPAAGLSLLPKSVLATLPIKTTRSSSLQQYSPQTQYDGPSSPLTDTDHGCVNMSAQVPRLGSSATPSPLASLFSETEQDMFTDAEPSDESDDDHELGMDLLLNMTVKSLHNLASYPNPNQKKAQRALLRGIKPALGLKSVARSEEPGYPLNGSPGISKTPKYSTDSPGISHRPRREASCGDRSPSIHPVTLDSFDRAVGSNPCLVADKLGSATRVLSSGAPLPLTAGPPGQRQYRPSTFESTFKALHTSTPTQDSGQEEDGDVLVITRQTLRQAGINAMSLDQNSPSLKTMPPSVYNTHLPTSTTAAGFTEDSDIGNESAHTSEFLSYLAQEPLHPSNVTPSWAWGSSAASDCWASSRKHTQHSYAQEPRVRTAKDIEARSEEVNRAWYAGADFLLASSDEIAIQVLPPTGKGDFGAIGDGRPSKKGDYHYPMSINHANRMTVAEHARPLFNMAHANVQQFLGEEWQKNNTGHTSSVQATK
ncbi:hypothetical protein FPOAC1_004834 [Fusarium poae]|uniref:Uncharacterized protein n=1 Tax=Fusarium poae TaxID=36050 RepID=A0A1B8ATI1_FUSPO|nr:hypothetical protein FPOAC1_004834 [Fusarium poae]KAG8671583.1 hypothetical protein FPOAC1_004834 [Fusarium poae]OBS23829.1 hypothetical protein FPOA_04377 [Fusarium poae]